MTGLPSAKAQSCKKLGFAVPHFLMKMGTVMDLTNGSGNSGDMGSIPGLGRSHMPWGK